MPTTAIPWRNRNLKPTRYQGEVVAVGRTTLTWVGSNAGISHGRHALGSLQRSARFLAYAQDNPSGGREGVCWRKLRAARNRPPDVSAISRRHMIRILDAGWFAGSSILSYLLSTSLRPLHIVLFL